VHTDHRDGGAKEKGRGLWRDFPLKISSPFGPNDKIGMLNLIDARSRDAIVSRANASKIFDLSVDYFVGMPSWDKASDRYQIWMTHTPSGEQIADHM